MIGHSGTRGYGLLEGFLAAQRSRVAEALIPDTARKGRILDIGCGSNPHFLLHTVFEEKVGLDKQLLKPHPATTSNSPSNLRLVGYDVEHGGALPFKDDQFSVVTMLAVLEHVDLVRLAVLLHEIRRVLVPNGCLILTTPTKPAHTLLRGMAMVRLVSPIEVAEHRTCLSLAEIRLLLQQAGFSPDHAAHGYFEFYCNRWMRVVKS